MKAERYTREKQPGEVKKEGAGWAEEGGEGWGGERSFSQVLRNCHGEKG